MAVESVHHEAVITKDGYVKEACAHRGRRRAGVERVRGEGRDAHDGGLFQQVWECHNQWTDAFFAERIDRRNDPGRFDRAKAPIIMEILRRQLLSPVTSSTAPACCSSWRRRRARARPDLDAIFDFPVKEVVDAYRAGTHGQGWR